MPVMMTLTLALSACGGVAPLSKTLFNRLSRDARLAIYDRENDIVISRTHLDEALRSIESLRQERSELRDHFRRTETRLKKTGGRGLELARKANDARYDYLSAEIRTAETSARRFRAEIEVGYAQLDLTQQQQLVRFGLAPDSTIAPRQATVKSSEERARVAVRKELDLRTEAQKVFLGWKSAEEAYVASSGDFDSGVWID